MTLRISSELLQQLLREAAASPNAEVCGLLIGETFVERIIPAANVAEDTRDTFEIDPAILFAAIRAERAGRGTLLGYYHSHPVGPPTPSDRDTAQAVGDRRIWLIIGKDRVTAWRMTECNRFNALEILIEV